MKKIIIILSILLISTLNSNAQELRPFNPIRTPVSIMGPLPPGSQIIEPTKPLPERVMSESINAIADAWNTQDFHKVVSDSFYNKSRLIDSINTETPRDARLKLLGTHNANILRQAIVPDSDGGQLRVSTVSVITKTRAEFNDPKHGFISAPGTNEMILEIVEKLK